jgi:hypothetical protein
MKMKTLITAALVLASASAFAGDVDVKEVGSLPTYDVASVYSNPGEGRTVFVKRAAETLRSFTAETGYEACGWIAVISGPGERPTFSIKVVTLKAHIACGTTQNDVLEGYASMGVTIHSHPVEKRVRLTPTDMKARGTPAGKLRVEELDSCGFSSQDYSMPGFLVACGKVYFQNGVGTQKEI